MGNNFNYEFIVNSLHDGIFSVDKNFIIRSLNPAGAEIIGWSPEEAIGKKCHEVFRSPFCDNNCPLEAALTQDNISYVSDIITKSKTGKTLLLRVTAMPLRDKKGNIIGGLEIFSDQKTFYPSASAKFQRMGLIGASPAMTEVYRLIEAVAPTNTNVLITGDTGTGKELVAKAVYRLNLRKNLPYVKVNCAALPETLLEAELFGHTKGAFTGAINDRIGRFETANNGTIFLDEIAEISPSFQAKLLRVIQEGEFERVGSSKTIKTDLRIIAATNKNLQKMVQEENFRADLFYRLNVFPINVPPLKDRREDILILIDYFINEFNSKFHNQILALTDEGMSFLSQYDFPGNIRELRNIIEHAFVKATGNKIKLQDLPQYLLENQNLIEHEPQDCYSAKDRPSREEILQIIENCDGNKSAAARKLNIARKTLYNWLEKTE